MRLSRLSRTSIIAGSHPSHGDAVRWMGYAMREIVTIPRSQRRDLGHPLEKLRRVECEACVFLLRSFADASAGGWLSDIGSDGCAGLRVNGTVGGFAVRVS